MEAKDTIMNDGTKRQFRYILDKTPKDVSRWDIDGAIELQAEISFEAGIREGVRRIYEDVKARHYIIDYDLEVALKALEKYKDKIALAGGGIGDAMVKIGAKPSRKGAPKVVI